MDLATKIKSLLKGAEIYRSQGLLIEARENYNSARKLIVAHPQIKNRDALLNGLDIKLDGLDIQIHKVENAPLTPEISAESQTLIKKLFSFSQKADPSSDALDGAIALIKFGQYARAIEEFEALLDNESVRLVAAKNILRCHLTADDVEAATRQYGNWLSDPRFGPDLIGKLRAFLEMLLRKKEIQVHLPEAGAAAPESPLIKLPIEEPSDDEVLDINAVSFQMPNGARKDQRFNYEVSFQSGNVISILIEERDKDLIEDLHVGETLEDVELTSPIAIFNGTAKIMEINQVKAGPRKGCFSIDLKIKNA